MAKRIATSDLNHDNWDKEDKREEAGTFRKAEENIIQSRVIRQAKRRATSSPYSSSDSTPKTGETKNVFANFGGFKMASNTSPINFNFGVGGVTSADASRTLKDTSSSSTQPKNGSSQDSLSKLSAQKDEENKNNVSRYTNMPNEFYGDLKALNESVSKWIQMHVGKNPCCILTPVFKDYEMHLSKLEERFSTTKNAIVSGNKETSNIVGTSNGNKEPAPKPFTFTFGVTSSSENLSSPGLSSSSPSVRKPESRSSDREPPKSAGSTTLSPFSQTLASSNQPSTAIIAEEMNKPQLQFSFGSQKPFTFANVSKPEGGSGENGSEDKDDSEEPPKVEFTPVVEKDAVYSQRCKVFVKKGGSFQDRGVGTLFLKPVSNGAKTQLLVRADTSLGNVLLNTLLFQSMPLQRMGNNNVMLVCIPTPEAEPPPIPVLLRVKTAEDADNLLKKLKEHIK